MDLISLQIIDFRQQFLKGRDYICLVSGVLHLFWLWLVSQAWLTSPHLLQIVFCEFLFPTPSLKPPQCPALVDNCTSWKDVASWGLVGSLKWPPQHLLRNNSPLSFCPPHPPRKREERKGALESGSPETQLCLHHGNFGQIVFLSRLRAFLYKMGKAFCRLS